MIIITAFVIVSPSGAASVGEPVFVETIDNVTVTAGRDVRLACVVDNLGTYKVRNRFVALIIYRDLVFKKDN